MSDPTTNHTPPEKLPARRVCSGRFLLPLPAEEAIAFFTPEGERPWAGPDWDPRYPGSAPSDEPGTVFTTQDGKQDVVWVILSAAPGEKRYVRVTPGVTAGTVSVRCRPASDGQPNETQVEVTYELVALTEAARQDLADFARDYASFLADWPRQIRNAGLA